MSILLLRATLVGMLQLTPLSSTAYKGSQLNEVGLPSTGVEGEYTYRRSPRTPCYLLFITIDSPKESIYM